MPAKWFICPDNRKIEIQDCLNNCRMKARCANRSYLRLVSSERVWTGTPSTTQLISGTMYAYLKLTKDYPIYPGDRAFMIHGTKGHAMLEAMDDEQSFLEERLNLEGGITGIADSIEIENRITTLWDVKTSGSYKICKAIGIFQYDHPTGEVFQSGTRKGEPKTVKMFSQSDQLKDTWDWGLQLNLYRIMFEKTYGHVDTMKIFCVVRDGGTWIAFNRGVYNNTYVIPIQRLNDEEVLGYFEKKRKDLLKALDQKEWQIPCNEQENWGGLRCDRYCEVSEYCPLGKERAKEKEKEMPIRKLGQRWQLAGNIRLGIKTTNQEGKQYPKEVDYFILDPKTTSAKMREQLMGEFQKEYGEEPKSIDIMFPGDDVDTIFPQWYKRYGTTTLLQCKGDGADAYGNPGTAICMHQDFTKGLKVTGTNDSGLPIVECMGDMCPYTVNRKCSAIGSLYVVLPKLSTGLDVWRVTTGSITGIEQLNGSIAQMREMLNKVGIFSIAGIPLKLERIPTEIAHEGKKTTHYIMRLVNAWKVSDVLNSRNRQQLEEVLETRLAIEEDNKLSLPEAEYDDIRDTEVKPEPPKVEIPPVQEEDKVKYWADKVSQSKPYDGQKLYKSNKTAIKLDPRKDEIIEIFKSKGVELAPAEHPPKGQKVDAITTPTQETQSSQVDEKDELQEAKLELKTLVLDYEIDIDKFNARLLKDVDVISIDMIQTMEQVDKVRILLDEANPNQPSLC